MMALRGKMSEAGPLPIPIYNVCQLAFTAHSWGRPCWVCSTEIVIIAGSGSTGMQRTLIRYSLTEARNRGGGR